MRSAVILLAGAAAVSAAVTPAPFLFSRQINHADLVPVGCVDVCGDYVKYAELCGEIVTPEAGDACMEICKPEEWAKVLPCAECMGKVAGIDMSNPTWSEPPLACTNPEVYITVGTLTMPGETPAASADQVESTPAAAADAEVTPVVGAADAAADASTSAFKITSPAPPARATSASAGASASASATPTSGAGKAAVSMVALGAALLIAAAF